MQLHALGTNTVSQDYTKWNLPPGVKARLGKGRRCSNDTSK